MITVEDHYMEGGMGEAVTAALCDDGVMIKRLSVSKLPRSGKPEELLADAGIDAAAIMRHVHSLLS